MEHENKPLTLEQLREAGRGLAYIEVLAPEKTFIRSIGWCEIEMIDVGTDDEYANVWWPGSEVEDIGRTEEYGKTWLAYACKPINFDKWEPCELCIRFGETDPCYKDMCFKIKAPNCGYACSKFLKWRSAQAKLQDSKFCPECGRPLTPAARELLERRLRG